MNGNTLNPNVTYCFCKPAVRKEHCGFWTLGKTPDGITHAQHSFTKQGQSQLQHRDNLASHFSPVRLQNTEGSAWHACANEHFHAKNVGGIGSGKINYQQHCNTALRMLSDAENLSCVNATAVPYVEKMCEPNKIQCRRNQLKNAVS